MNTRRFVRAFSLVVLMSGMLLGLMSQPLEAGAKSGGAPQVVVISLDGARADIVEAFLRSGVLDKNVGLGRLDSRGVVARQNITLTPSLTAVSHIGTATGSSSAQNDIPSNTFYPVAATIGTSISGFAAPIGWWLIGSSRGQVAQGRAEKSPPCRGRGGCSRNYRDRRRCLKSGWPHGRESLRRILRFAGRSAR